MCLFQREMAGESEKNEGLRGGKEVSYSSY